MAITTKLELRQTQSLVMTPQLQQAIKLLQLSNLELGAFVESELERNPLLERLDSDEGGEAPEGPAENAADNSGDAANGAAEPEWLDLEGASNGLASDSLDTDLGNVFPDGEGGPGEGLRDSGWAGLRQSPGGAYEGESNLEAYVAEERTLRDHLVDQLALACADPAERLIGQHLIDMADEAGYVRGDLEALAERLGAPLALVEKTLALTQSFEPAGVMARDLRECLALQLKEQDRLDPAMAAFIENLDLLAAHDLAAMKRACRVSDEDLYDMIAEVKRLNPKPGLKYGSSPTQPVVPDVLVRALPDGSWHVELNSETLPRVLVNRSYYTTVSTAAPKEAKGYLAECLQNANWLVKSLDQRARTILKVAQEIVRQQDGFLTYGVQHLKPLNLKTVADAISMHESTVSRVTANKYMATNRGIFELKYFFTSSIAAAGEGDAHSSEAVRHRIKQMIDAEPGNDVLSDDKIVEKLRDDGIDIARRTVAKYREALRIPSSVQRRRLKRATLDAGA